MTADVLWWCIPFEALWRDLCYVRAPTYQPAEDWVDFQCLRAALRRDHLPSDLNRFSQRCRLGVIAGVLNGAKGSSSVPSSYSPTIFEPYPM